jgi:hypothetical protein
MTQPVPPRVSQHFFDYYFYCFFFKLRHLLINLILMLFEQHFKLHFVLKILNHKLLNDIINQKLKWSTHSGKKKHKSIYFYPIRSAKQLLLNPVIISRNLNERILIEGSVNSVRISIAVKQVRIIFIYSVKQIRIVLY